MRKIHLEDQGCKYREGYKNIFWVGGGTGDEKKIKGYDKVRVGFKECAVCGQELLKVKSADVSNVLTSDSLLLFTLLHIYHVGFPPPFLLFLWVYYFLCTKKYFLLGLLNST